MRESDVASLLRMFLKQQEEDAVLWLSSGKAEDMSDYKKQCGRIEAYRETLAELMEIEEKLLAE